MSSAERQKILAGIASVIMRWQDATQEFDEAFGDAFDLNPAERRCLGALVEERRPAGAIAGIVGLTPAAITALIDRLEVRGFLRRERDTADRRKVFVAMTDAARAAAAEYYGPIAAEGRTMAEEFSEAELEIVKRFLEGALQLQQREVERVRARPSKAVKGLKAHRGAGRSQRRDD